MVERFPDIVKSVNPNQCYFIANYPDGKIVKGKNLFEMGWNHVPNGLSKLEFVLSTGEVVEIPSFIAYSLSVESSTGPDGHKIFHSVTIKGLNKTMVCIYRIILRQDNLSKLRIGDVVVGKEDIPKEFDKLWKFTG